MSINMLTLVAGLVVLLAAPYAVAVVDLSSSVDVGRQFTCPGELVTFTCQVFRSFSLEWRSPPSISITYSALNTPPDIINQSPFEADLTSVSMGDTPANSNITSTLRMTEPRNTVSVQCLSSTANETESFTMTGIPDPPQSPSVRFDNSTEMLTITITWQPPDNSGQFDLDSHTVNVTSTSGLDMSVQVPAGTTTHQFTDSRNAIFNVTITAMNRCGQTGAPASLLQQEFALFTITAGAGGSNMGCIIVGVAVLLVLHYISG